jgi:hypothetical protein
MQLSDRFDLGRALGHGAFGTTYVGHERTSGRAVAIKQLRLRGLPEWHPFERFEREARVLRSLDHPGLPAFIDAFEAEDGDGGPAFCIVSELIEGPTLQAEIASGRRWSASAARALLRSLLETLDYLHSLSPRVIHRDIKPGNVIVRADERPVLVDFGSVRDLAGRTADGDLTIAGTAGYMAPEQAQGIADVRSDLYGLGATMAHALTHVHPSELPRTGLRPRLRDLAGIDEQLGRILERLLEPEPERRYESAAAVLRELDEIPAATPPVSLARTHASDPIDSALARLAEPPRAIDSILGNVLDTRDVTSTARFILGFAVAITGGLVGPWLGVFQQRVMLGILVVIAGFVALFVALRGPRGRARRLFASGRVAQGEVRRAVQTETRHRTTVLQVGYAFRHDGREYTGTLHVHDAFVAKRVESEMPVLVFFDPARPDRNIGLLPPELPTPDGGGQNVDSLELAD